MRYFNNLLKQNYASFIALILNFFVAYIVYFIARCIYFAMNNDYFPNVLTEGNVWNKVYGTLLFDTSAIFYTNSIYIILMLFPLFYKETRAFHKFCKWWFVIVNSACFIINVTDSVYFPFTLRRTTTTVFREFENETNLTSIFFENMLSHWYLFLIAIIVIYAMTKMYVSPQILRKNITTKKQKLSYTLLYIVLLALSIPVSLGAFRGGLKDGIRPITLNNANEYATKPMECALILNTPFTLIRTIGKNVFSVPNYYTSENEAKKIYNPIIKFYPKHDFEKKNVVILILESFGREYFGAFNKGRDNGEYKGFTPHLDELIKHSLVFEHSFANGRKSIDGMPSVLCGIPMFIEPFVLTPASMNNYTSIAGILDKEGYETAFFHNANRGSMGFLAFAEKAGFEKYFGREDFENDKKIGSKNEYDGVWGIWDEPFLQYFSAKMSEFKEPFMTAIFTTSSHDPFNIPQKYKNQFKEGKLPIHKCIEYTDMALSKFFATAKKQKWFENTLFIITSDHTNISNYAEYQTDLGRYCAPIIFYDPSNKMEKGVSKSIAQQLDISPTVLDYLGYSKSFLSFGQSLISTNAKDTYAVNYANGVYQYVKYGYVLQFDGTKTKAIYALNDKMMKNNLVNKVTEQKKMEEEIKAIIYQYMYRMVNDKLMP